MSFYTQLSPFIEYIRSIRKLKTYLSFDMEFPTKWSMPKSLIDENQVVGFETENTETKGISFVTEISDEKIDATLYIIAKLIKLNKEKEIKEKLFKQTVEQLKQTFEKTDLDKLQNLYFDFETGEDTNLDIHEPDEPQREDFELVGEREKERPKRVTTTKRQTRPTSKEIE
jgi:hypothetical protein